MIIHPAGPRYDPQNETQFRRLLQLGLDALERRAKRPYRVTLMAPSSANFAATNAPVAVTEMGGVSRFRATVDLFDFEEAELFTVVTAAGAGSSTAGVQYTTDLTGSSGWDYLDAASGPSVSTSATGLKASGRVKITDAARRRVVLRPVTAVGDAAADPAFGLTQVEFR